MKRLCEACQVDYDDTYQNTICPHDGFEMRCIVSTSDGASKLCTTVEEVDAFLAEHRPEWRRRLDTAPGAPGEDPAESLRRVQSGE